MHHITIGKSRALLVLTKKLGWKLLLWLRNYIILVTELRIERWNFGGDYKI